MTKCTLENILKLVYPWTESDLARLRADNYTQILENILKYIYISKSNYSELQ